MKLPAVVVLSVLALPANAQQQGSKISLSCNGSGKLMMAQADAKPDQIANLGIVVDVHDDTVTVMQYVTRITGITDSLITFSGRHGAPLPGSIDGTIDRVTGHTTVTRTYESAGNDGSWELMCHPVERLF
jgi:hypothetical protein